MVGRLGNSGWGGWQEGMQAFLVLRGGLHLHHLRETNKNFSPASTGGMGHGTVLR